MVVISYGRIKDFYEKHPDSKDALNNWYRLTISADWSNYHEMRDMFNSVDAVSNDRFVFDIRGNTYRLVAMIFFDYELCISVIWGFIRTMIRLIAQ